MSAPTAHDQGRVTGTVLAEPAPEIPARRAGAAGGRRSPIRAPLTQSRHRPRARVLPDAGGPVRVPRSVLVSIGVAIAGMPLLVPTGPGNSGLADVGLCLCLLLTAICARRQGWRLRLPYVVPVGLSMTAGGIALARVGAPAAVWLVLVQDLFVLVWALALANLARDPAALRVMVRTWARAGIVWAALLLIGVVTKQHWLSGVTARNGARASLTFGDANLAAGYFVTSLLMVRAARCPARRLSRYAACALLLSALVFTGSNGGLLALAIASAVGCVLHLRRRGPAHAVAAAGILTLLVTGVATNVNANSIRDWAQQQAPILRDGIGRSAASSQSRTTIADESLTLWRESSLLGIGPTMTKSTLSAQQAPYVKEAHDDYVAALIERGLLGAVALLLLIGLVGRRMKRVARLPLSPAYAASVPRPELLVAAAVGYLTSGFFYEVLHFRHLWALLGIATGLDLWGRRR